MWWLILHVKATEPQDAQTSGQTFFLDVPVKVFLDQINIWVSRLLSLMWVGPIQSVEGICPVSKRKFLLFDCLLAGTSVFFCLQTLTETMAFPVSRACWPSDYNYPTGSPAYPACQLSILELLSHHNHVNQILTYI